MTTCLLEPRAPVPLPSPRASAAACCGAKRLRAHSDSELVAPPILSAAAAPEVDSNSDSDSDVTASFARLLKTHKQLATDSPSKASARAQLQLQSPVSPAPVPVLAATSAPRSSLVRPRSRSRHASWPIVTACASIKYSLAFLQDSRMHAMALLAQDEWQRAMTVLEKVERANDMVARQRRRMVLEQANKVQERHEQECETAEMQDNEVPRSKRSVRFCEDAAVVIDADDCDRSPVRVPLLVREEILILRASRTIPAENFSEFWN